MIENRIIKLENVDWRTIQNLQPEDFKTIYNYKHIEESIQKNGFANPFYVWENKGKLYSIDGVTRREVLSNMENVPELLPALFIDAKNKKEAIKILLEVFNLKENPIGKDILDDWLQIEEIEIEDINLDSLNVVDIGLESEEEVLEAEEDDFDATPPEIPITVLGDLYEIGEHRLLCGDSTDSDQVAKLMNGEKADMVFTDPPFPNNSEIMHDMIKNIDGAFNNSRLFCDKLMIWFWDNLEFPPFLEQVTSKHIWHKTNGWQAGHFETMYCYHNDGKRHEQKVYSVNNVGGDNNRKEQGNHPTPKPISLIFEIINDLSKNSKLILDLFLGSGTTMLASHQLNRKCYGMELDPKYCDVIVKRMKKLDPELRIKLNGKDISKEDWINN